MQTGSPRGSVEIKEIELVPPSRGAKQSCVLAWGDLGVCRLVERGNGGVRVGNTSKREPRG